MSKLFERVLYVDADYDPQDEIPQFEGERAKYETVMHALIGDCVFWSLEPCGYHKKLRVTVELISED